MSCIFLSEKWNIEFLVKNSDGHSAFIDVAFDGTPPKFIEYKWLTSNTVGKDDFIREFIKRDLYSDKVTALSQIEWRIKGQKLTKQKVLEYMSSVEGRKALNQISYEKALQLFPNDLLMTRNNYIDRIIANFGKDEIFKLIFK